MNIHPMRAPILTSVEDRHRKLFGEQVVKMQHRLAETGLFTDEKLGELIDKCPNELRSVNTMGYDLNNPVWREGDFGNVPGVEVIEAIRKGRMWTNIRRLMDYDDDYRQLLDKIFGELEGEVPGLETFKRNMTVLISSPKVQVFYHADIQGQALWQVSGVKRVYVYPTSSAFVTPETVEKILLHEQEEEMAYEPWYDDYAQVFDLQPGEMLHWPLYGPHRVENHDCLNISLTTEHWTKDIWRSYATNFGNGALRRSLGLKNLDARPEGMHVYAKAAAAFAWKKLKKEDKHAFAPTIDFRVDPASETGMKEIDPYSKGERI